MAVEISVLICTRNRAEQLRRVLETAALMTVPVDLPWELIVIDNGSTDHTPEVVASFQGRLPIRHVPEPQAGLSNARNRGVGEAAGRYICWTDDDVMIDRNWLAAYAAAFVEFPDAAVFAGVIQPAFTDPVPQWLLDNQDHPVVADVMARRDFGPRPVALSVRDHTLPFGANFAVRAREQRQNLYDPNLGVSPAHRRLGEETEVVAAILSQGGSGVSVPGSKVLHIIPPERQTRRYISTYYQLSGETAAYRDTIRPARRDRRTFGGVPIWRLRRAIADRLVAEFYRLAGNTPRWLHHIQVSSVSRGYISFVVNNR